MSSTKKPKKVLKLDEMLFKRDNFTHIPNASIDLLLSDPPFNIARVTNFHTYSKNTIHSYKFDEKSDEGWDSYKEDEFITLLNEWSGEFNRVLRKGGSFAIFCADAYLSHLMDALRGNNLSPRRVLNWNKSNAVPINRAYMPTSAVEYIVVGVKKGKATFNADVPLDSELTDALRIESTLVSQKVASIVNARLRESLLSINSGEGADKNEAHINNVIDQVRDVLLSSSDEAVKRVKGMYKTLNGVKYLQGCVPNFLEMPLKGGKRIHPTEKPVALLEYIVALLSNRGDRVLDPFAGSGSTGEACLNLGRIPLLVERETKFYNSAKERLSKILDNA